jgi:RNA polymerase sigma-70 factor (ECF subfamily)
MNEHENDQQRLSHIATQWSLVFQAHTAEGQPASAAALSLVERYRGAVYRYLLAATRDPDAAEELCHEFAIRFLRGDFRRADPVRGRFRYYLKTVLINLVNDYHAAKKSGPKPFSPQMLDRQAAEEPAESETVEHCLREQVLDLAWEALERSQPHYFTVLRLRADYPEMTSRQMSQRLLEERGQNLAPDTVRKTLERARARYADLLLDEAAQLAETSDPAELRLELEQLDLLKYCRSALERRNADQ